MIEKTSLGEAEHEFFLGVYRSAVAFYQPRIEKKTGVPLGKIGLWDYSNCIRSRATGLFARCGDFSSEPVTKVSRKVKPSMTNGASNCSASYYANGIYMSFSSRTVDEEAIAVVVVHELAHTLWESLALKPLSRMPRQRYREKYDLFVEGFATYAECVWFIDLYPVSVRQGITQARYNPKGTHYRGMRMIEALVQREGPQILFDIPKRWPILA